MELLLQSLPIFWLIIKCFLYIIIAIVAIILVLVTIVFMSPIKYSIHAKYENNLDSLDAGLMITWLAKVISIAIDYKENSSDISIKLFGINITDKILNILKKEDRLLEDDISEDLSEVQCDNPPEDLSEATFDNPSEILCDTADKLDELEDPPNVEEKTKFFNKLDKIKWKIQHIYAMIKKVWIVKDKIVTIFQLEIHRTTLENLKLIGVYLWHHLKPKYIRGQAHFGFDDPSITANTLALYSVLLPILGEYDIELMPEFNDEIMELDLKIGGKVYLRHLLVAVSKTVLNKGNRHTFKTLRRIKL